MSLKRLSSRMKRLNRDLPRRVNVVAREVAEEVLVSLTNHTPVDTSQAVSNWQLGYNEANFTNIPPHFAGKGGSTKAASASETLSVGKLYIRGKRPGVDLHISNGLDYIMLINAESSSPGFLQKALAAGRRKLASSRLRLK